MASTIASNARTGQASTWGARAAFATASALYVVLVDTSGVKLRVYKSTNGTSWTQQDSANALTPTAATAPYSCTIAGGVIYIAYYSSATSIQVGRFDTSTDTFATVVGGGDAASAASQSPASTKLLRVAVRSDGDVLVTYERSVGALYYVRYEGASWSSPAVVDSGAGFPNDLLMDVSDRAVSLHNQDSANDFSYRTLDSANTLGTIADFDTTVATTPIKAFLGCTFNDGTNNKVGVVLVDSTNELDFYHAIQGEPLGSVTAVSGVNTAGNEPQLTGSAVETFNSKIYACWSKANTILYGSTTSLTTLTFGTDQTLIGSLTDTDPIPQFIKGLSGIGVVYNDGGSVKVEWISAPNSNLTIPGSLATASGAALSGSVFIDLSGSLATASGTALAGNPSERVTGSRATSSAAGLDGALSYDANISGSLATASGAAGVGLIRITSAGSLATASGAALAGSTTADTTVVGSLATASGDALSGSIHLHVVGSIPRAIADALAGKPSIIVTGDIADALGSGHSGSVSISDGSTAEIMWIIDHWELRVRKRSSVV